MSRRKPGRRGSTAGVYRTAVAGGVALAGLAAGGVMMERAAAAQETEAFDRAQLRQVTQLIEKRYVEVIPPDRLYRMAIDGMLDELGDPNSRLVDRDESTDLEITMTGNYSGLGIRVQQVGEWVTVMSVISGTPAEREGVLAGDRIVGVDGQAVAGWDEAEVIELLRGPEGDPVTVRLVRFGLGEPIDVTVTRERIHVPPVLAYALEDDIGVVQLTQFSREAREELNATIEDLVSSGARRLVLDLRGNPGGLLEEGVAVSELFVPDGVTIVTTASRVEEQNHVYRSERAPAFPDLPTAILIDGASASASEIVAGALQDHDRALVVGTPSFGKGSMQTVYQLPGGDHLKLTTANWYTPSGRSIQREPDTDPQVAVLGGDLHEQGLPQYGEPDIEVIADTASRDVYHTMAGRPVYGGGGIVPDVIVSDSLTDAERRLGAALKRKALSIRQLAFRYAVRWVGENDPVDREFRVTPEMRAEFRDLLSEEGVEVDDATWRAVGPTVDRYLAIQIANTAFDDVEALRRSHSGDAAFDEAVARLRTADDAAELLGLDR